MSSEMGAPTKLAALISGGGRTLMNLADEIDAGRLHAEIACVIASREAITGVERARERGFDVEIVARGNGLSDSELHDRVTSIIVESGAQLTCLCGWLRWMRMDPPLVGTTINIHPALLPNFGGKGMYGDHVHAAVIEAGRRFSGCTVHFVDERFDHGPTILQRVCPVFEDDTVDRLAARVFKEECRAYPEAIKAIISGQARLDSDQVIWSVDATSDAPVDADAEV